MRRFRPALGHLAPGLALLALAAAPALVAAQSNRPDFLFKTPRASLGVHVGYDLALASSEVFDFAREQLTLSSRDFDAPTFGVDLGIRITPRLDLTVGFSRASTAKQSEMRGWVGTDDLPIEQTTDFVRMPLTVGVKGYLRDRGRSIGRFAWIPRSVSPYLGTSVGWVWYRFEQDGEFVDFDTYDIFQDHFTQNGRAPTVHVFGGAEWSLGPSFFLTTEGRYQWAKADMAGDFVGFDPMDLSGFQATAGLAVRF
ncbi:MAG TPA: hypothetical protein VJ997_13105 [Longimicrobiales bacterium]|nr:hypothetical protein [Longimicrobiales bacterium]